jgi:hypothetical protein
MLVCTATIKGTTPYSQSRPIQSKKAAGETHDTFEEKTWRERIHSDDNGVYIPPMALKNCLSEVAKFLSESVPSKGKATYTKHFEAGTLVVDPIHIGVKLDSVQGERLFVPSDGKRGGSGRVWKTFPVIPPGWSGEVKIVLIDPVLVNKPEKVREYLEQAGRFIGMGRFRPRNNGFYGRFEVTKWSVGKM